MWIALFVLAGWCLLSLPVALVVGRLIKGPSAAVGREVPVRETGGVRAL